MPVKVTFSLSYSSSEKEREVRVFQKATNWHIRHEGGACFVDLIRKGADGETIVFANSAF